MEKKKTGKRAVIVIIAIIILAIAGATGYTVYNNSPAQRVKNSWISDRSF